MSALTPPSGCRPLVSLVGPWPRPWGGVAVHIYRLSGFLADRGICHLVFNTEPGHKLPGARNFNLREFLLRPPTRIIHCHSHLWGVRLWLGSLALRGHRVVITVHSLRRPPAFAGRRRFLWELVRGRVTFVAVNSEVADTLVRMGARRVRVVSPYLPPGPTPAPQEALALRERHRPLILSSAFSFKPHGRGDLYGLLELLDFFREFLGRHPGAGLVVLLAREGDPRLAREFERRARALGPVYCFVNHPVPLSGWLQVADLYIRNTREDSYGISIAEALSLGVPVVATRLPSRPPGVLTYSVGDTHAMLEAAEKALKGEPSWPIPRGCGPDILKIYGI